MILKLIHNLKTISGKTAVSCNWFWTKMLLYVSFSLFLSEYHSWENNTINLILYTIEECIFYILYSILYKLTKLLWSRRKSCITLFNSWITFQRLSILWSVFSHPHLKRGPISQKNKFMKCVWALIILVVGGHRGFTALPCKNYVPYNCLTY